MNKIFTKEFISECKSSIPLLKEESAEIKLLLSQVALLQAVRQ
jgi:hypothetical protein